MTALKLHPELARNAIRHTTAVDRDGERIAPFTDRCYRLWTLARHIDTAGSGRITVDKLKSGIARHKWTGLSRRSLRRILRAGEGIFWQDTGHTLRIAGLAYVCEKLSVDKLRRSPVLVEVRWGKTLRAFRAACYGGMFSEEMSNPISRATLERLTGRSRRTLLDYERAMAARLHKKENAVLTARKWQHNLDLSPGEYVDRINGKLVVLRRIPNSYNVRFESGQRGQMRKVNKRLCGNSLRLCLEGATKRKRIFYRDTKAAHRRMQAAKEGEQFVKMGAELHKRKVTKADGGTVLWTDVQRQNGALLCSCGNFSG